MIKIDSTSFIPLYEQVKAGLKREIALGAFKPLQPLPSIRDLAAELMINPNTVARAYGELERDRLITTRKGKGCFVAEDSRSALEKDKLKRLDAVFDEAIEDARKTGAGPSEIRKAFEDRLRAAFEAPSKRRTS